jgi:hypothetical protein
MGGITITMKASPGRISWEKAIYVALALMCLFVQDAFAATPWPTTQFKVDFTNPGDETSDDQDSTIGASGPNRKSAIDFDPVDPGETLSDDLGDWGERSLEDHNLSYDVLAMFFETSLNEIAVALEQEGFEPPDLPLYNDGANVYFKVNIYDLSPASAYGLYHSKLTCSEPSNSTSAWLGINAKSFIPLRASAEAFLYFTLAHELFHSIQKSYSASYRALDGCRSNTKDSLTVTEGTATGVAFEITMRRWPKYYLFFKTLTKVEADDNKSDNNTSKDNNGISLWNFDDEKAPGNESINEIVVWKFYGGSGHISNFLVGWRSYQKLFLDFSAADSDSRVNYSYKTSSFWFNLIARYDIQIVDHLLRQPLRYGDNPSLLEWLDDGLASYKTDIGGLYLAFPHFVTEFASQAGSRFPWSEFKGFAEDGGMSELDMTSKAKAKQGSKAPGSKQELQMKWIEEILGECKLVELVSGDKETVNMNIVLDRVSAACVEILWDGFEGSFELVIEAESSNLRLVDQLQIGLVYEETEERERYCYSEVHPHYREPLWTCMHEKPFVKSGPQNLRYIKNWTESGIGFTGSGRRIIAVSNVAKDAEKTRPISKSDQVKLRVGIVEAKGADGRQYDPPNSVTIGSPGMITMSPENLYGITKSPAPAGMRLSVSVAVKGDDLGYAAVWMAEPPSLGYKGPYKGVMSGPTGGSRVIMSSLCARHSDGVIGQITRFDRDHLWIDFDADLCEMTIPPRLDGRYPKVDHFKASLRFPFGWRYSAENSPVDIVTPGMQIFIDRHAKRLPMVLSGTWNNPDSTPNPGTATTTSGPGSANPGGPPGAAPSSGGSSSGGALDSCTCSCEELADFDSRAEEAKKLDDNDAMKALASQMMGCMGQCQREYMICRMDSGEAEKQKKELVRKQEAEVRQAKCDCSCEALDDLVSRGQEFEKQLQKQFAEGGSISNENILQLTQCYSACQQEAIACAMKK